MFVNSINSLYSTNTNKRLSLKAVNPYTHIAPEVIRAAEEEAARNAATNKPTTIFGKIASWLDNLPEGNPEADESMNNSHSDIQ